MKLTRREADIVRQDRANRKSVPRQALLLHPFVQRRKARRLFLYWDMANKLGWAESENEFRKVSGVKGKAIRVSHKGFNSPTGYHKPNGELAFDAIEIIPTMGEFIRTLSLT